MSLSNSIIQIHASDTSLNESLKDKRRRSTFYVDIAGNQDEGYPRYKFGDPAPFMPKQKFKCASAGCSGNTTFVMILPDGDDFGDSDDENGGLEVRTVNGKQVRDKVKSYYDNRKSMDDGANLALRKTPSMSSVQVTPKRPGVIKSQSNNAVITVRNAAPIKMHLSINKDQKCKTLPPVHQTVTPKSPNKLALSFVRRAHSAKLTRSNSFLKALATKCAGPSLCKDDDVGKSEVIPLNKDMLKEALNCGAGRVLAKAVNGVLDKEAVTTSTEDDEDEEAHSGKFVCFDVMQKWC